MDSFYECLCNKLDSTCNFLFLFVESWFIGLAKRFLMAGMLAGLPQHEAKVFLHRKNVIGESISGYDTARISIFLLLAKPASGRLHAAATENLRSKYGFIRHSCP